MIVVERRYEYYSYEGKKWTDWFNFSKAKDKKEAQKMIKQWKEPVKNLKGEYRIKEES